MTAPSPWLALGAGAPAPPSDDPALAQALQHNERLRAQLFASKLPEAEVPAGGLWAAPAGAAADAGERAARLAVEAQKRRVCEQVRFREVC